MLCLQFDTPAEWAEQALADVPLLLSDHRHLELKASRMALSVAAKWGDRRPALVPLMDALSAEELEHAARVERLQDQYGRPPDPRRGNPYVRALRRRIAAEGFTLPDLLLVNSLIEARSAERFRLLARTARGTTLGGFYEDLYAAEVGHHVLFTGLAAELVGEERMRARLAVLSGHEADVVRGLPCAPRMH